MPVAQAGAVEQRLTGRPVQGLRSSPVSRRAFSRSFSTSFFSAPTRLIAAPARLIAAKPRKTPIQAGASVIALPPLHRTRHPHAPARCAVGEWGWHEPLENRGGG